MKALTDTKFPVKLEDNAAGTDAEEPVFYADDVPYEVVSAQMATKTALTADATNYATYALKNGSTTIASFDTSADGFTAKTYREFTITAANAILAAADTLTLAITHAGTGVAIDSPVLQVTLRPRRG